MKVRDTIKLIFDKLWIVLLVTIPATGITFYINSCVFEPVYEANFTLYIIAREATIQDPFNYDDVIVANQLANDYKEILKSVKVAKATLDEVGITDMTPEELLENINVERENDTSILFIGVRDVDPVRAMYISNTLSRVFIETIGQINPFNKIGIVDMAVVPETPVGPDTLKNVLITLMAGIVSSVTFVVLYFGMNNRIRSVEEVERITGLDVIGILPRSKIK